MVKVEERIGWVYIMGFILAILDQQKAVCCPRRLQWSWQRVCPWTGQYYFRFTGITEGQSIFTNKSTQTSSTRSNICGKNEHKKKKKVSLTVLESVSTEEEVGGIILTDCKRRCDISPMRVKRVHRGEDAQDDQSNQSF